MRRLILATRNNGKIAEIKTLLSDLDIELLTLVEFPSIEDLLEDGNTFEENALKKAEAVFRATHLPSLADDSGLEVFSLGMRPGIHSARYAGSGATDKERVNKLLTELQNVVPVNRKAQFTCAVAFVGPGMRHVSRGLCTGTIALKPLGTMGFGYDPIFTPDGHGKTFGELPASVKNVISHRARALLSIKPIISKYFV